MRGKGGKRVGVMARGITKNAKPKRQKRRANGDQGRKAEEGRKKKKKLKGKGKEIAVPHGWIEISSSAFTVLAPNAGNQLAFAAII